MIITAKKGRKIILHGRGIVGGKGEGSAIVLQKGFCGFAFDPNTGKILTGHTQRQMFYGTQTETELIGEPIKGRVLVYFYGTGSSTTGSRLYNVCMNGNGPAAIINRKAETMTVVGAIAANVPFVVELNQDPCQVIETGDYVNVDADKGIVEVTKKK